MLLLSNRAIDDLEGIWVAVATNNDADVADRIIDEIFRACELIADFPGLGRRLRGVKNRDVLGRHHSRWWRLYRRRSSDVEIVRIVDAARDMANLGL